MSRVLDREIRRAQLVSAAATVFAERGVGNATVGDIVKEAGVAQGTFYLYFDSKDDAVLAVAERLADATVESIERAVAAPDAGAVDKLFALRDAFGDSAALAGASELIEIIHLPGNRVIHDRLAEHLTPRLVAIVERIVQQGVDEGVFAVPDTHAAAWFVLGGLQSAELSGVPLAELPAAITTATALALRALGYPESVTSSPSDAIATHALGKRYGDLLAVDALDLSVRRGEIYGFLGRNGAGKTTTIRMLLGLIRPSTGEAEVLGTRVRPGTSDVFARVGYLVESAGAYPNLTVRENLEIQRRLTGASRTAVAEAIALMRLESCAERRAGELSLGNKQRVSLARALLHRPELLVLDEPANALDPAGIVEVRELLRALAREQGVTVFMSSHILAEVAHLADRIGIVHEGRLLEELDRRQLRETERLYLAVRCSQPDRAATLLAAAGFAHVERVDGELRVFAAEERTADIARELVGAGLDLTQLSAVHEDLEAHFLRLTGGLQ